MLSRIMHVEATPTALGLAVVALVFSAMSAHPETLPAVTQAGHAAIANHALSIPTPSHSQRAAHRPSGVRVIAAGK